MPAGISTQIVTKRGLPDIPAVGTAPTLWLRADKGVDVSTEGAAVGTWNNQQGGAGNATQATTNNKPTLELSGLGGRPCIRFLKTSFPQHMTGTITLSGASQTVFMACNLDAHEAGNRRLIAFPTNTPNDVAAGDFLIYDPNSASDVRLLFDVTDKSVVALSAAANHVLMVKFDGTNTTSAVDGTAGTTVAGTASHATIEYILAAGRNASAPGYLPVNMRLAEVAVYNAALSTGDVTTVTNYMKTRYGIA